MSRSQGSRSWFTVSQPAANDGKRVGEDGRSLVQWRVSASQRWLHSCQWGSRRPLMADATRRSVWSEAMYSASRNSAVRRMAWYAAKVRLDRIVSLPPFWIVTVRTTRSTTLVDINVVTSDSAVYPLLSMIRSPFPSPWLAVCRYTVPAAA